MVNLLNLTTELYDSHCHLNAVEFDSDREHVVQAAVENGVKAVVDIGIGIAGSEKAIAAARKFPHVVYATVGVDMETLIPGGELFQQNSLSMSKQEFWEYVLKVQSDLDKLIRENREFVVGIGETGMDNHHLAQALQAGKLDADTSRLSLQRQEQLFRAHLELASHWALPLSVHTRALEAECLELVKDYPDARGIFHSYTGDYATAKQVLDTGWSLGVNGIVTFNRSAGLREVYTKILGKVSADWTVQDFYQRGIYFETDAPFLAPQAKRGERNVPANVQDVYQYAIAALSK